MYPNPKRLRLTSHLPQPCPPLDLVKLTAYFLRQTMLSALSLAYQTSQISEIYVTRSDFDGTLEIIACAHSLCKSVGSNNC